MAAATSVPFLSRLLSGYQAECDAGDERILDAAADLFKTFGLRRTSVDDVARAAAVSRITVYRRFPGKTALVEAVLMREARRFIAELDRAAMRHKSVEDRIVEGFVVALRAVNHP